MNMSTLHRSLILALVLVSATEARGVEAPGDGGASPGGQAASCPEPVRRDLLALIRKGQRALSDGGSQPWIWAAQLRHTPEEIECLKVQAMEGATPGLRTEAVWALLADPVPELWPFWRDLERHRYFQTDWIEWIVKGALRTNFTEAIPFLTHHLKFGGPWLKAILEAHIEGRYYGRGHEFPLPPHLAEDAFLKGGLNEETRRNLLCTAFASDGGDGPFEWWTQHAAEDPAFWIRASVLECSGPDVPVATVLALFHDSNDRVQHEARDYLIQHGVGHYPPNPEAVLALLDDPSDEARDQIVERLEHYVLVPAGHDALSEDMQVKELDRVLTRVRGDPRAQLERTPRLLLLSGRAAELAGHFEEALELYKKTLQAVEAVPKPPIGAGDALFHQARLLALLGRRDEAEALVQALETRGKCNVQGAWPLYVAGPCTKAAARLRQAQWGPVRAQVEARAGEDQESLTLTNASPAPLWVTIYKSFIQPAFLEPKATNAWVDGTMRGLTSGQGTVQERQLLPGEGVTMHIPIALKAGRGAPLELVVDLEYRQEGKAPAKLRTEALTLLK
jgi:hypothetical protein